nr:zinc-regulated transporter 2 [Quercus suber]
MIQDGVADVSPRSSVSLSALHAEIARRQASGERPECGSGANTHGYNTGLHVAALFLILILSTLACSFPIVVRRFPKLPVPNYSLFLSRHFGTGVLIATAFVHLLPTAFTSLTDPCLPRFWNDIYPAMPGFIAMVSVLVVVGIEMFFTSKGAGHSHSVDMDTLRAGHQRPTLPYKRSSSMSRFRHEPLGYNEIGDNEDEDTPFHDELEPENSRTLNKPLPSTPSVDNDSDMDLDELEAEEDTRPLNSTSNGHKVFASGAEARRPDSSRQVSFADPVESESRSPAEKSHSEQRMVLQCLLLEAGILFHSVFIGMALSVSTGPAFIVLLLAISFHQTFEGLALGSRIAAIPSFSTTSLKPWTMSLMYGITTPIGQAIGLAVHRLYDPASQFGLLTVGIVNAISSGLLLYAGLVQLLAEDFLTDQSYEELTGRRRLEACAAVVCGSMLMAFVGAFA